MVGKDYIGPFAKSTNGPDSTPAASPQPPQRGQKSYGGVGLADGPGVRVGRLVAVGLGKGVTEGVRASSWVTCTSTVAAISVRRGFKSMVGVLVRTAGLQAANHNRLNNIPITLRFFLLWTTRFFLYRCWQGRCQPVYFLI